MEADSPSQSKIRRRVLARALPRLSVALALAAGLVLRLWMLRQYFLVNGDALVYGGLAKNLLLHGRYALDGAGSEIYSTLIRLPGYPLFLALCFRLFGMENYASACWVQIALELAGCLLLADFARRIVPVSRQAGAAHCTLWLAALCPFTAIYVAEPLTESLTLFVIALALWSAARFRAHPAWGPALWFTFAVSYAALLRPDGALVGVALAPALLIGLGRREGKQETSEESAGTQRQLALKGRGLSRAGGAPNVDSALAAEGMHIDENRFPRGLKPAVYSFAWMARLKPRPFKAAALPVTGRVPKPLRIAAVCALLALMPFAAWSWRNWQVFHVFQPLAPRLATDPGEDTHRGWERWVKSWCLDFVSTYDIYWNVPGDTFDVSKLPARAFDSPAQYAETAVLAADYNVSHELTPEIDARFGKLADERFAAHPLRSHLWLPLGRVADMWLRPRVENLPVDLDWWVYAHHNAETSFSWTYAGLNAFYLLLAVAGLYLRPRFWPSMLAYMLLRSALLATVQAPEARYTLECFPMLFALGGVALYRFTYWVLPSVFRVKASAGRV